jgi:hypothetical protein
MKKSNPLLLFILSLSFAGMAQTEKGAKLIGGTGTLHFGAGDYKGTLLAFSPYFGGFVATNFALGASAPLYMFPMKAKRSAVLV